MYSEHVDQVDHDVDLRSAAAGLGADQVQLVLGPVDQDDPGPQVAGVAGPGLAERGGDHLGRVLADGPGQPLGQGLRPGPEPAAAVPSAGRGDHVVRAALRRLGVVHGDQGGHSLAVRFLPGGQPGAHLPQPGGGLRGGGPQRPGPHHDALAVGGQDHQRRRRARLRDPGGAERGDIGGGRRHGLLELPFADDRAAPAGDGRVRGLERAAGRLQRGQLRQGVRVPARWQGQGGVGRAPVARSRFPPGAPGHPDRAEQGGQQPAVPGLQPGPGDPVGTRRGSALLPGPLFFPRRPQVVVVLQQLPDYLPAPLAGEVFQLAGREPGRGGTGELGGQRGEHGFRDRERIIRGNRRVRCHEGSSSFGPDGVAPPNLGRRTRYRPGFAAFPA